MEFQPKTDKNTRILMLYHQLLNGEQIDKTAFSIEHGINERTFDRDIEDIRIFLSESYSGNEVNFDRQTKSYYMTGERAEYIDRMDAAVLAKILFSSSAFRSDEMEGLLQTVLSMVTTHDAKAIKQYLQYDREQYRSQTKRAVLKIIGDLFVAINNGNDIELSMTSQNGENVKVLVSPLEIELYQSTFFLIATEGINNYQVIRYPIEEIEYFKVLDTVFAKTYQEKYYQEKENKKHGN